MPAAPHHPPLRRGLRSRAGSVLALSLLVVAVRLPSLRVPIWNVDEGFTAVTADAILAGGVPYRDAVDHRAPLTSYAYALVFALFGRNDMAAVHGTLMALVVVVTLLVFQLGRVLVGERGGTVAALAFVFLSTVSQPPDATYAFHTEWCVILFTCLGSYAFVTRLRRGGGPVVDVATGIAFGLATVSKHPAAFDLLAVLAYLVHVGRARAAAVHLASAADAWRTAVRIVAGWGAVAVTTAAYFAARGALRDFVFYTVTYNTAYYLAALPPWSRVVRAVDAVGIALNPARLGVAALFGAGLVLLPERGDVRQPLQRFVVFWLAGALAGAVSAGRTFGHYFIQILPPMSLAVAIAVDRVWSAVDRLHAIARGRVVATLGVAVLAVALLDEPTRAFVAGVAARRVEIREHLLPVATYVARHTGAEDRLFVWGFVPEIYVLADRHPATRFSYCTFVTGLIPGANDDVPIGDTSRWAVPGALETLVGELTASPPAVIVDASVGNLMDFGRFPLRRYPALWAFVQSRYHATQEFRDPAGRIVHQLWERNG